LFKNKREICGGSLPDKIHPRRSHIDRYAPSLQEEPCSRSTTPDSL